MFFRMRFQQVAAPDSANDVLWTFGLSGVAADATELGNLAADVRAQLVVVRATGNDAADFLQPLEPLYAESFDNIGGPAFAVSDLSAMAAVGADTAAPTEVQVVISRNISTPRGASPLGRFYFGPVGGLATAGNLRVSNGVRDTLGAFMLGLHAAFLARGRTPQVIRKQGTAGATGVNIVSYGIDDAWDTQRRRGVESTVRETYAP